MRSRTWKALAVFTLAGALVASLGTGAAPHSEDWESATRKLEGTWRVEVKLYNCQTNGAIGAPFQSLLTFARGGTMTETTANPLFFPAQRGPGHGVWSHTGHQKYSASSLAFITVNGALAETQKITQTIEIGENPDEFTTTEASVQFFDPTGKLLPAVGCATATAQRFE
jgi:hypothetical protein